jgi:L-fuculose-phosphate aldolase
MVNTKNIRKSICEIGKLLFDRELTDSSGGNISVREGDRIYVNPKKSGVNHQWDIEEDSIIVTDLCRIPLIGKQEDITREAATHYHIYQNFPDVNAVIHAHPLHLMAFGAAHKDLPAISEGTRAVLGEQPITNVEESIPASVEQAERVVKNFKDRRKIDPEAPLICGLPFHGTFAAAADINLAFLYTEVANNCAKILIYRKTMFGDDPTADFSIHQKFTKEDFSTIDMLKEVCTPGYVYRDAFGNDTVYKGKEENGNGKSINREIIDMITREVLDRMKDEF